MRPAACPCCLGSALTLAHTYRERPEGETAFTRPAGEAYHRELWRCETCGHFLSTHAMSLGALYDAGYVDSTYGGLDGIRKNYERIMALDPAKSDNAGRVERVIAFAEQHFGARPLRVLDIGSGLGVFLGKLKRCKPGWTLTALEPDPRFAQHARETLSVEAVAEDYMKLSWKREFDLITLNKVLEHIEEPRAMLDKVRADLAPGGIAYIELPDGDAACSEGFGREEFFIEHHHVFSMASMELLLHRHGLRTLALERLREPSTKFTLRCFAESI
ncbi:MAG: class I SAM-dependent methyltransferase [Verrucomicrobiaceae bacterium]|nr:class I SAM-dependent methyltransferase [Verrucomicrobiaceae bacterium]